MVVKTDKITIEVGREEWKKAYKEWQKLTMGDKIVKGGINRRDFLHLHDFIEFINMVYVNPAHSIDQKLNSL